MEAWPKADEIRWAQWRVRERKAVEAGRVANDPERMQGQFKLRDYQTWLLREKDEFLDLSPEAIRELFSPEVSTIRSEALPLPYQKIGDLLFPEVDDPDNRKKRAADARNRVESEFGRGSLKRHKKQSET
jgi:hypothetical protein